MNKNSIIKKILSLVIVFCMVAGIAFSNVGTKEVQADTSEAETDVTTLLPLTFADFNLADGDIVSQTYSANYTSGVNGGSTCILGSRFEGYVTVNNDETETITTYPFLIFGGDAAHSTFGWAGIKLTFKESQIEFNTSTICDNAYNYVFPKPETVTSFINNRFKLAFSIERANLDGGETADDVLFKLYVNDELCIANATTDASKYGADGSYYILNSADSWYGGYIRRQYVGSTEGYCDSITVESCELPYTSTTTFSNYGLADQTFAGTNIGGTVTNTMEYTKFVGDVTLGGAGTAMLNYGATESNNVNYGGLQVQITADTGAFWLITGTRLGGKYLNESDTTIDNVMYYSSGLPLGGAFRITFNSVPWDWDGDGSATDGKIEIRVDGKLLKDKYIFVENMFSDTDEVTLVNRIGVLAGQHFNSEASPSTSTLTIASVVETSDDEGGNEEETSVDKRILTFADFGITDGTYDGGFGTGTLKTVDSTKIASMTLADSEISGYVALDAADRSVSNAAYWIVGHNGWAGLQVLFQPYDATCDRINIVTSSLTSVNPDSFLYVLEDGLFDDEFKITLSFDTADSDGDKAEDDLALRLYINDKLIKSSSSDANYASLSKGETEGEYYICDYKADAFRPYMRMQNMSSTGETYYKSIAVRSCALPYKNTATFVDYGISDQEFSGAALQGKFVGTMTYTQLRGTLKFNGEGTCMLNYGSTTVQEATANSNLGGLRLQVAKSGAFWIMAGTRLGTSYLNETDGETEGLNTQYHTSGMPIGKAFDISFNTIPWDWDGDGVATDGKIEIRIDDKLLKDAYIIIEDMCSDSITLVNRFAIMAAEWMGGSGAVTVQSEVQDVSRLRKVEIAEFGLANGDYVGQVHKSTGPSTLVNTMMEMNVSVEESTGGSWIHYAVPLDKGGWYGTAFQVSGSTITVANASGSIDGGTIKASEIQRDTFFGEPFKMGLSIEKVDLQGDGENNDARLGVWIEGKLLRNYYYVDKIDEVGTGMSVFAYVTPEETYQNTVTITDVTETNSTFETTLGLDDMNASGVAPDVYGYSDNPETKTLNPKSTAEKDGDLDNTIFSTNVRFSKEHAKLFYGCPTDSGKGWYGIWIGPDGNKGETFTAHYAGSYPLLDMDDNVVPDPTMHAGVAGVQLVNNTYKLGISTRYVDSDGDDLFDDLEVGIWFNDVSYNNTYFYIDSDRLVSELKPNIAVNAANSDGYVVLGDYTQETATEVVHCADEFAYFVDGADVTVGDASQGTSWTTDVPGEYAVTYTNTTDMGTSTFEESVLVYKTNDVTADGTVSAVDLVALKKLAAELRSETTAAGKKAVGYAEDADWYTAEVLNAMHAKLLADENTIGAKVMSDAILGETGSQTPDGNATYITSLGATKEGTSVIGISDVEDAAGRTYTTDIDAFDGSGLDFVLDFDTDREIKVLQITDTQIIDAAQCRTDSRLSASEKEMWATDQLDYQLFDELKALVAKEKPDLIVMTGDNVYGEFDDSGAMSTKLVNLMDEFKIPWAPIFGNHDNEIKLGVSWQCNQFAESKYCIFNRRNEIGGNGNYAIGISIQGKIQRTIFMMDTNGCNNLSGVENQEDKDAVTINFVFHEEQMAWYRTTAAKVNAYMDAKIPSFLCVHVPLAETMAALVASGCQAKADSNINGINISHNYNVGNIVEDGSAWTYEKDANGNFGFKTARSIGTSTMSEFILPHMKAAGTDGTFFGHTHSNGMSVEWEGIRFTYGLKTGFYDTNPNQTGGTVIKLNGSEFDVNHAIINNLDAE